LLTALPGAQILELSVEGIIGRDWAELELTANWRHFLETPEAYLRHLFNDL
jgi:predicted ATPase